MSLRPGPLGERELDALIRTETPRLYGVVRAFADDDAEAEDLLQGVWVTAAERAHLRDVRMPIGAWLHTVALNLARAHRRRAVRRRWLALRWRAELPPSIAPPPAVDDTVRAAGVWRAVAALPALQRDTVLLRVVEGLSTRETAERLGRAEGTVKASLHRGLAALRSVLATRSENADAQ